MRSKQPLNPEKVYQIEYGKKVSKFLFKHPEIADRLEEKEDLLRCGNFKSLDIKKLQGQTDDYRLRIGKYRFLFTVKNDVLVIYFYEADSRGDVY